MEINKILSADILDIIFEGKNKEYGAYELRKTYNKRLVKAIVATTAIILLLYFAKYLPHPVVAVKKPNVNDVTFLELPPDR